MFIRRGIASLWSGLGPVQLWLISSSRSHENFWSYSSISYKNLRLGLGPLPRDQGLALHCSYILYKQLHATVAKENRFLTNFPLFYFGIIPPKRNLASIMHPACGQVKSMSSNHIQEPLSKSSFRDIPGPCILQQLLAPIEAKLAPWRQESLSLFALLFTCNRCDGWRIRQSCTCMINLSHRVNL